MDFGTRIRVLRNRSGLTQKELAKLVGVSTVTVQCWENNGKSPSMNAIIALSRALNTSSDQLLGISFVRGCTSDEILSMPEIKLLNGYRSLDSRGKGAIDALLNYELSDSKNRVSSERLGARYIPRYFTPAAAGYSAPVDGEDFEMIAIKNPLHKNADFAVRIQGASMSPYINDGETVFVQRVESISNGDIGIFCVDGAMYCKQQYVDSLGNLSLISLNEEYKSSNVFVSSDSCSSVKVYGKVLCEHIRIPAYFSKS